MIKVEKLFPFVIDALPRFFLIAMAVIVIVWVYVDAQKRGFPGLFWVATLIFTNIVGGLFIYLALRDHLPAAGEGSKGEK